MAHYELEYLINRDYGVNRVACNQYVGVKSNKQKNYLRE